MLRRMEYYTSLPHGIFLVTGPTGSGKSTTLYSALKRINQTDKKIITIEDPVEYQMDGINQIHVNPQIGLTFAAGLRHIVRQDPDVIMVGEIRDGETAEIAIQAALTGHLVFSTLHTNDAASAVTRLVEMGTEPFLVSSSVIALMAQRLVRRVCTACRRTMRPAPQVLADLAGVHRLLVGIPDEVEVRDDDLRQDIELLVDEGDLGAEDLDPDPQERIELGVDLAAGVEDGERREHEAVRQLVEFWRNPKLAFGATDSPL